MLVTFTEDAPWSLWDIVRLKQEFKNILGREIDLIEKSSILNPFIQAEIMKTKEVIYGKN